MFKVNIKNLETGNTIVEDAETEKDLDDIVNWFYNNYGDSLEFKIVPVDDEQIKTRPYSERPICPGCANKLLKGESCSICNVEDFSIEENPPVKEKIVWIF